MNNTPPPPFWNTKSFRWLVWLIYVAVWTRGLLMRRPFDSGGDEQLGFYLYVFSKATHIGAYAALAVLSGWIGISHPKRWLFVLFMSAHAMLTEYLQNFVATRNPSWEDVGLDHMGIVLGMAVSWAWWRAE